MRLGIAGLLPRSLTEIDAAAVRRIRAMGFSGAALTLSERPAEISSAQARELGRHFAAEGVELVEYGQYDTTLVHPEQRVRAANVANLRNACRVARALGCPAVIAGLGSLNPAGQWFPHPENHAPATLERLIATLRLAAWEAEEEGVSLALECHVTTTLKNAATARMALDAVGSAALKIHLDPVNWLTFPAVYNNAAIIAAMFETLGPGWIYGAHSKGATVEDRLIVHLNETHTGAPDDLIDHAAVLRGLAAQPGDPYLVIEHLPVGEMPGARAHLLAVAARLGLGFNALPNGDA